MRSSKVTKNCKKEFLSRIKEFSIAIYNHGIERLYNDLKSNDKITETYLLETFRTDFKRMKKEANGFFNEPALIGAMCEILQFPVSSLFGGPLTNKEETIDVIKTTVKNVLQEFEHERKQPKKRIYSARIINNSRIVHSIIFNIIHFNISLPEPFVHLFVKYSAQEKSWDFSNEERIVTLLNRILDRGKGKLYYYNYKFVDCQTTPPFGDISKNIEDDFWNTCLIIAYQLSCIEKLYDIFRKEKNIKIRRQKVIQSFTVRQDSLTGNDGSDQFATALHNFSKPFDDKIADITSIDVKTMPGRKPDLIVMINNLQKIIEFLLNPNYQIEGPNNNFDEPPINYFLSPEYIIKEYFVLNVTDKEIGILQENINIITGQNIIDGGIPSTIDEIDFSENWLNPPNAADINNSPEIENKNSVDLSRENDPKRYNNKGRGYGSPEIPIDLLNNSPSESYASPENYSDIPKPKAEPIKYNNTNKNESPSSSNKKSNKKKKRKRKKRY